MYLHYFKSSKSAKSSISEIQRSTPFKLIILHILYIQGSGLPAKDETV